jgi:hypothetical protein
MSKIPCVRDCHGESTARGTHAFRRTFSGPTRYDSVLVEKILQENGVYVPAIGD